MSFPNIIYGDYGDEKVTSSTKIGSLPLGARMILPDGRIFAHARASATALVVGKLYQGEAYASGTGNIKSLAVVAAIAAANTITITMSGTGALTKDQYEDGYIFSAGGGGNGEGYTYKIKSCASAAAGSSAVITLYETDPVQVTMSAATSTVGLRVNEFKNVLLTSADTIGVNSIAGIAANSCAASCYCWLQRRGLVTAFTDNTTLIVGIPVTASTTVAGAVGVENITLAGTAWAASALIHKTDPIGYCVSVAASVEYSLIDLRLE